MASIVMLNVIGTKTTQLTLLRHLPTFVLAGFIFKLFAGEIIFLNAIKNK